MNGCLSEFLLSVKVTGSNLNEAGLLSLYVCASYQRADRKKQQDDNTKSSVKF